MQQAGNHQELCFFSSCEPSSSRLLAICTAVASRFVVDRACLKFAPFYGLSIETHLFTAAYEWRLYEKLGKDPGSVGCKQLWRQLTRGGDGQAGETCAMQSFGDSWKVRDDAQVASDRQTQMHSHACILMGFGRVRLFTFGGAQLSYIT